METRWPESAHGVTMVENAFLQSELCLTTLTAAVISAKSKEYFEFCCVPIIPMSSKHIWSCNICSWSSQIQPG